MNNNFSLLNIIGGLSKTLNIANQMIPLYKQVKPLISNSGKVFNTLKNFNSNNSKAANQPQPSNQVLPSLPKKVSYTPPTFFQ